MERADLYVNLNLLPGAQIRINQYHTFIVKCCSNYGSGSGMPMSLDYFIKISSKIAPYIVSVETSDPDVRDTLLRYIPENKIIYVGGVGGIGGEIGGGGGEDDSGGMGGDLGGGGIRIR
ncbi:MAG: hypothetical protein QXF12_00905 [Candidatus Aenigmatarchaeota archaeon]